MLFDYAYVHLTEAQRMCHGGGALGTVQRM
jgi:hypothetical protein